MTGFRWAGAPSYTKITSSSGSRFVLACARKLSKRAALILLRAAEENTSPLIGEIAIVIVKFRPRRILDGTPSLPAALYRGFWPSKCCNCIRRQTHSGALRHGSETRKRNPLACSSHQVCSCPQGGALQVSLGKASRLMSLPRCGHGSEVFSGSRLLSPLFIRASVSKLFSFMISSRQSLISSSTRTLFQPPRGLSWILPSLM